MRKSILVLFWSFVLRMKSKGNRATSILQHFRDCPPDPLRFNAPPVVPRRSRRWRRIRCGRRYASGCGRFHTRRRCRTSEGGYPVCRDCLQNSSGNRGSGNARFPEDVRFREDRFWRLGDTCVQDPCLRADKGRSLRLCRQAAIHQTQTRGSGCRGRIDATPSLNLAPPVSDSSARRIFPAVYWPRCGRYA